MADAPKTVFQYWFEGGAYLHLYVSGDISTADALDQLDVLVGFKRLELEKRKMRRVTAVDLGLSHDGTKGE